MQCWQVYLLCNGDHCSWNAAHCMWQVSQRKELEGFTGCLYAALQARSPQQSAVSRGPALARQRPATTPAAAAGCSCRRRSAPRRRSSHWAANLRRLTSAAMAPPRCSAAACSTPSAARCRLATRAAPQVAWHAAAGTMYSGPGCCMSLWHWCTCPYNRLPHTATFTEVVC